MDGIADALKISPRSVVVGLLFPQDPAGFGRKYVFRSYDCYAALRQSFDVPEKPGDSEGHLI
jgi:hypothetical protein